MEPKGLAMTIIFQAESANYGESIGNVASLKKISRNNGDQYTYISRQALRYNMIEQLGEITTPVSAEGSGEKTVIQFAPDATIDQYPEIDFFGYLKTEKGSGGKKRSAKVRLSNAISLETFKGDLDFLTNKGLADRLEKNMNLAQSEIHKSYYCYTVTMDLDQIGIDGDVEVENTEKARRVNKLLDTISLLYRDIRGRREDLKPLFVVGGVYDVKNPIFQNAVKVENNRIDVLQIKDVLYDGIKENTYYGLIKGIFDNDSEIRESFDVIPVPEFFRTLKDKVTDYYESN
ncbi:type I-B CRISPR-associated protein Cas7/Cst2/DevR [Terrilactibacillus laevilacticus]|uniref:Type I-B CRISPR-associated protein Cas7/Cst2/DevR n=1 Tax=Terrilactibacillus laevilacticus TaxID=1380157 RepID=A0ABW5PMI1_9BACI|nr:type I-B CRISPR-associated protein Cas7/Cst2/DevR [Terrilactibacillus laevilacticus]